MIIRPLFLEDLDALTVLAVESGVGVTTLPDNKKRLLAKLQRSQLSYEEDQAHFNDKLFFFTLEDEVSNTLAGVCAIEANIGANESWYNYRLSTVVHASQAIDSYQKFTTLNLSNDMTGSSELCSLFLKPDYRNNLNGKLLSKCRFLFMAEFPQLFSERIIGEMRGVNTVSDNNVNESPFWQSLGAAFFQMSFSDADYLIGSGDKAFVAQLMPHYPIYTHMLSQAAQGVISMPHQATAPALAMLEAEGFHRNGYVDIFDAGPVVSCDRDSIRAVKESRILTVTEFDNNIPLNSPSDALVVSNQQFKDFRCILVSLSQLSGHILRLTPEQIHQLQLKEKQVRVIPVKPEIRL
jgi:arginine N-succinyltransferase